jgi:hypothetical protein
VRVTLTGSVVVGLLAAHRLAAQASEASPMLRGRIIDARTAAPIRDVSVTITTGRDTLGRARSDTSGMFQSLIGAPATSVVVHFNRIGYRADSLKLATGLEAPLRVAMVPLNATANTLAAIVVRDTARSGFERRARRNTGGAFIRLEDIEKTKPVRTSDLFRSYPGVRIDDSSGVTQLVSLRSTRQQAPTSRKAIIAGETVMLPSTNAARCVLRIGTDGRLMPPDFSVDDVRPADVIGIELYLGAATIPTEFSSVQRDAPCGIVMIWTKNGTEQ